MATAAEEVEAHLARGKEAYLRQDWMAALACDEQALALASAVEDLRTQSRCHRFVGLSLYRAGGAAALARSEDHFRRAHDLAQRADDTELWLAVSNHLGATLRDLGRHDEAYDLFREALRVAVGPALIGVRARLLGNLGALFDELDQRASADDCYARYEELLENLGDPRRLANARALAGRAALLRGDLDGAAWRFDEEMRAGELLGDRRRRCSAQKHRAELAIARLARVVGGDPRDSERLSKEAEEALAAAWAASDPNDDRKVRLRIALKRAEFLRGRGRIADAHAALGEVGPMAEALDHPVVTPKLDQLRARVCADAGLHGEALWYLERATRRRVEVIAGLRNDRVRAMTGAWVEELRAMANELRAEAFLLPRGAAEREAFDALFARITGVLGPDVTPAAPVAVNPWEWHDRLRKQSQLRWEQILGDGFGRLNSDSRDDLVRADVTYHGAVDDLGRSAHLLAIALERELRERVLAPLRAVARDNAGSFLPKAEFKMFLEQEKTPSLGTMVTMLEQTHDPRVRASFEAAIDRSALDGLASIAGVGRQVISVAGAPVHLVDIRNAVADGRSTGLSLDRVSVDALKRALTLDAPVALKSLLEWRVSG
ncbi:MAG: hypothetical protein JWM10_2449 [Myxococcaceae bacterium]|nr:hypothetical protein [Myxococcaceae bacterium]